LNRRYSEWSSPVVLVPKPNGKWRLCIDYHKVNDVTEKNPYSLTNIDEIFDSLDSGKIFITLDLYSGYHQILMDEESVEITSFTTKFGNYQFKVMPFWVNRSTCLNPKRNEQNPISTYRKMCI